MSSAVPVLLVHNSADIYGASRSLLRLVSRLDRNRFIPSVLLPVSGPLQLLLEEKGVRVFVQPSLRVITRPIFSSWRIFPFLLGFPFSVLQTAALIKREHFHLVHTNVGIVISSALAAWCARVPHLWHIRDWFQEFGFFWKPYSLYIRVFSQLVLCVSRPIANQFPPSPKIRVVHNGLDLSDFPQVSDAERTAARLTFSLPKSAFVVGVVGRIKFVRKGQEFLLRAVKILRERGVPAYCLLVGGHAPGSENHILRMRQLAAQLGLTDNALFVGELNDPRPAYAAMDVFVLPSAQPEPFGGVVLEAMALELPVVATALGGSIEQVVEGVTGFLVPPADPKAIADRLEKLAQSPALRQQFGHAGRSRIQQVLSLDRAVVGIEAAYTELLQSNPTQR